MGSRESLTTEMLQIKMRLGNRLLQAGELAAAANYFREVAQADPENEEAQRLLRACSHLSPHDEFAQNASNWLEHRHATEPDNSFWRHHRIRYLNTLVTIFPHLQHCLSMANAHRRILELGGGGAFTEALKAFYPGFEVESEEFDLRFPFPERIKNGKYDLILCMEVIEHVIDRPTDSLGWTGTFRGNGVDSMLNECRAMLVNAGPHAQMFISTPNINNWRAIDNLLHFHHPHTHYAHPREMAWEDLRGFCEKAKLDVVALHYVDSWGNHGLAPDAVARLKRLLTAGGFSVEKREDNIMILVRPTHHAE